MTEKKPAAQKEETKVEIEAAPDDETLIGFTPEEEAALDAAARSDVVKKDDEVKPAVKAKEAAAIDPDDEVTKLRKDLEAANARADDEKKKREEAEKKSVTSVDDLEANEQTNIKTTDERVKSDIELAETKVKDLERQYEEALDLGENKKLVSINSEMLDAKIKLRSLTGAKEGYEKWKDSRKDFWDKKRKEVERTAQIDPDAFNADDYTSEALTWINKHPEFKTDKKFRSRAVGAHHIAEAEGIKVDTPEYFEFIEKQLGLGDNGATEEDESAEADAMSAAAKVDAPAKKPAQKFQTQLPPSRDAGGQQRQGSQRIKKLSAAEKEAADISGMTPEEYWDEKYGNKTN